ncbi:PSPB protein, partial [Atrichornis clamosus]|nr:PSPB protein [Atrichornis clamosus]
SPGRVLTVAAGLGAPGGGCGVPPSTWCQSWVTALRCGALGRCPHLTQEPSDVDTCALCQQLFSLLHRASNQSAMQVPSGWGTGATVVLVSVTVGICLAVVLAFVQHLLRELQHLMSRQVCARLKLCHREPGGVLAMPVLGVPGAHLQGLPPEALPLPLPLCWLCRSLVARAE